MTANMPVILSLFSGTDIENHLDGLSKLLHDCVHAGASIGFILPQPQGERGLLAAQGAARRE